MSLPYYMNQIQSSQQNSPKMFLMYCFFDPTTGQTVCRGFTVAFNSYGSYLQARQLVDNLVRDLSLLGSQEENFSMNMSVQMQQSVQEQVQYPQKERLAVPFVQY